MDGPRTIFASSYTPDVSRNRVRVVAVLCGLLAIAARIYYAFELELRHPWLAWFAGSVLVSVLVPFGLFYALARPALVHRGTLRVDAQRGRFIADASPKLSFRGIAVMVIASGSVPVERVPNTDRMRLDTVPGLLPTALTAVSVFVLAGVLVIVMNRPRVILDRDGITVTPLLRSTHRAWADLVPGSVQLGPRGRLLNLMMASDRPGRPGTLVQLPTGLLHVDPMLLETAVRTYIDEPDRRAEIGTDIGLDRLSNQRSAAVRLAI